jgi:hypothetical protein
MDQQVRCGRELWERDSGLEGIAREEPQGKEAARMDDV